MKLDPKIKKTVWTYAVIMFTSAFIVLLIVGYSYLKSPAVPKQANSPDPSLMKSIKSITDENDRLTKANDDIQKELDKNKNLTQQQKNNYDTLKSTYDQTKKSYDNVLLAEIDYKKGDDVGCAELLKNSTTYSLIGWEAQNKYNQLLSYTLDSAIYTLYRIGRNQYWNDQYNPAILTLLRALRLTGKSGRADDIIYYLAKSYYDKGDMVNAKIYFQNIVENYKTSTIFSSAKRLLAKIK
jgi:TolA-binding protein